MLKRKGPLLVVALLVLVGVVGTMSVAYALWSKSLNIEGTVGTGRVHGRWGQAVSTDPPGSLDLKDEMGNRYEKDVGMLECIINPDDPEVLDITIHNGYPSYHADCQVAWVNDGTIPVVVSDLLAGPDEDSLRQIPFDVFADLDLNDDGEPDINLMVCNGLCTQVDPGEYDAYSIWIHVKQSAPQDGDPLEFVVKQPLNQWNEPGPKCSRR